MAQLDDEGLGALQAARFFDVYPGDAPCRVARVADFEAAGVGDGAQVATLVGAA